MFGLKQSFLQPSFLSFKKSGSDLHIQFLCGIFDWHSGVMISTVASERSFSLKLAERYGHVE